MDGKEYYPQAANEDLESDSLATVYVSHCHSQDHSLGFWLACLNLTVWFFYEARLGLILLAMLWLESPHNW